jgi:hypothetical protein
VVLDSSSVRFSVNLPLCAFLSLAKVKIYEFQEYRVTLYFRIHFQPWAHLIFNAATLPLVHGQCTVSQKIKEILIIL